MDDPLGFIESHKWTFARSMPHIPHWYVVKDKLDKAEQARFVELEHHIRVYGRLGIWHNSHLHWYLHLQNHGYYYWTMGWPIGVSSVINRAKTENDDVRYLDVQKPLTTKERALLDKWCDWTECPHCRREDPFAQQWAGKILVGLFCSSCRQRFL